MGGEFFSVRKFGWFPCQRTEIGSLRLTMKCVFQPAMFNPSLGFTKTLGVTATCWDFFLQYPRLRILKVAKHPGIFGWSNGIPNAILPFVFGITPFPVA